MITDGGNGQGRSALAAVRALAAAGHEPHVAVTGPLNLAASSRLCAGTVTAPAADEPGYATAIRSALDSLGETAGLLLASDAALVALDRPEAVLVDKGALAGRCREAGILTPDSIRCATADEVEAAAGSLGYPVVMKPIVSTRPAQAITGPADLPSSVDGDVLVQPFLSGGIEAVSGVIRNGSLVAVVHQRALRTWPIDCGTSCAAKTTTRNLQRERGLATLLADHDGIFQAQFLDDHLIDLNPRVYGSLPLAVAAGANLAALAVSPPPSGSPMVVGRPGVYYRWLEGDLRHLAASPRRILDHRPRRRTAHSIASVGDLGPQLARLRFALGRS